MAREGASGLELLVEAMGGDFSRADAWLRDLIAKVQPVAPIYGPSEGDLDRAEDIPSQVYADDLEENETLGFSAVTESESPARVERVPDNLRGVDDKIQKFLDGEPDGPFRHFLERITFAELYSELDAQPSRFALKYGGQSSGMWGSAARSVAIRNRHLAETLPGVLEARETAAIARERAEKVAAATLVEEGVISASTATIESFPNATVVEAKAPDPFTPREERLIAALRKLDLLIFHDPQIIERAGDFRRVISAALASEGRDTENVPADPVLQPKTVREVEAEINERDKARSAVQTLKGLGYEFSDFTGGWREPPHRVPYNKAKAAVEKLGSLGYGYRSDGSEWTHPGPSVFDSDIHRALAEIRETVDDRSSPDAVFGNMDDSAGISTSLRTLRAIARIQEPSSDSRRFQALGYLREYASEGADVFSPWYVSALADWGLGKIGGAAPLAEAHPSGRGPGRGFMRGIRAAGREIRRYIDTVGTPTAEGASDAVEKMAVRMASSET